MCELTTTILPSFHSEISKSSRRSNLPSSFVPFLDYNCRYIFNFRQMSRGAYLIFRVRRYRQPRDLIFACSYPSVCPGILYPSNSAPFRIHRFRSGLKICLLFQNTSYLFIGLTRSTDANCHWVFVSHVPKSQLSHLKMLHLTRSLRMLHFVSYARHCSRHGLRAKVQLWRRKFTQPVIR